MNTYHLERAAQAWCEPGTSSTPMDADLARAFAHILQEDLEEMKSAAEYLWIVLANTSSGDWSKQSSEWQTAAARARDGFREACSKFGLNAA